MTKQNKTCVDDFIVSTVAKSVINWSPKSSQPQLECFTLLIAYSQYQLFAV